MSVMGFFYRYNIHPFTECLKREQTLKGYAAAIDLPVIYQEGYDLEGFLQNVVYREPNRCEYCYHDRLKSTALIAKRGKKTGIPFYYRDFREYWKLGIEESKQLKLYRQSYCGCIYSEKERYFKKGRIQESGVRSQNEQ